MARSSAVFDYEGVYPQLVQGYKSSQLDNCTDAIMLGIAAYSEEPAGGIKKAAALAMDARRVEFRGDDPVRSLNDYVNEVEGKEEQKQVVGYTRYWHGYLIPLKLLLLFFDYGDIRFHPVFPDRLDHDFNGGKREKETAASVRGTDLCIKLCGRGDVVAVFLRLLYYFDFPARHTAEGENGRICRPVFLLYRNDDIFS